MSRQLKFRAWDMVTVKMVVWEDLLNKHDLNEIFKYGYDLELMQYTGVKDRNGVEIYEGDIMACGDGKVPTEIRWVQESSAFMAYNLKRKEYHLLNKYFEIFIGEIIGNIYDNPELMEE